ncbi:MAG: hypothetical protein HN347_10865 [Bacteroidetes bacterium]|nr:hypothetical protein [Bacteroidota bacterium]
MRQNLIVYNNRKLFAHEIEIKIGSFSDFVFDEDYKLKNLSDLEKFIKTYKHLPNVPSEQEVVKNGLNLGEMDALLLEKVEELTLYIIELNKKIAKQEKKIEILQIHIQNKN